ncbi:MAG: M23 family metallopeptidase [Stackebrandtia sp.]
MIKLAAAATIGMLVFVCGIGFASAIPFSPVDEPTFLWCSVSARQADELGLTKTQLKHAATIHKVAAAKGMSKRASVIGIATALQESRLHNYGHRGARNDHDSLGLFQQRPSKGWGTPEQVTDPAHAAGKFFDRLKTVSGWNSLPLTVAAQRVQRSAFPDAYAKHEKLAKRIATTLSSDGTCRTTTGKKGWRQPVRAKIVSGYRTPDRRDHYGVDFGAPRGTIIRAAATGTVTQAECQAWRGGSWYGCDTDGSPAVSGCGNHVTIAHANNILTVYCHMNTTPSVQLGQKVEVGHAIGIVGSTGNSSGPHLHYEVHQPTSWDPASAINPVSFMDRKGAPLK